MRHFLENFSKTSIAHILAVIIVLGCFVMLYILLIKEIPVNNVATVNIAVGFLFGMLGAVIGYFYGASKSNNSQT